MTDYATPLVHDLRFWAGAFAVYVFFQILILYALKNDQHFSRKQLIAFSVVMFVGFMTFFVADWFFDQTWGF